MVSQQIITAAAARELKKHNSKKKNKKISWYIFESSDRIGGRIKDIEFGGQEEGKPPTRTSGGYDRDDPNTPPENKGCRCIGGHCPKFNVEVGAGWFTGYNGIETKSCKKSKSIKKEKAAVMEEVRKEDGPVKDCIYNGMDPDDCCDGVDTGRALQKNTECKVCPPQYNTYYAISQDQGPKNSGNMKKPLVVHCPSEEEDDYAFLNTGQYYGRDPNDPGKTEMKPIVLGERNLPGFDRNRTEILVRAERFLGKFWRMIYKCVDYQSFQFYYQYFYPDDYGPNSSPFYFNEPDTISWTDFDVGFDVMPDNLPFWEQALGKSQARKDFCLNYHEMVKGFLDDTDGFSDEIRENAKKMYNFYKNFNYFSEFLDGQDMSFGNFGGGGVRAYGYDIAYSIDQRGLAQVVRSVMPKGPQLENLKLEHTVTKIRWKNIDKRCSPENPVFIVVESDEGITRYCAKKVISTVSLGVMEEEEDNIFKPIIDMDKSPYYGLGELVKLYFQFPENFWVNDTDAQYITYLMNEDFRIDQNTGNVRGEYFYNLDNWFSNLCEDDNKFCNTKSLFAFLSTPDLEAMGLHDSSVSNETFSERIWHVLDPLRKRYPDTFVNPNCWEFYDWKADKNVRGAYGVWKHGATYYDHIDFFKPRKNRVTKDKVLWISGEASCFYLFGFIEGAHEAGVRDAKEVINDLLGIEETVYSYCGLQPEFDQCFLEACYPETRPWMDSS